MSISSSGFGATSTTIADPVVVTFQVVDDSRHEIYSGPHPGHTDCPALNIGAIGPRASRTTAQLPIRVCQFHDELNLGDVRFQATIYVVP